MAGFLCERNALVDDKVAYICYQQTDTKQTFGQQECENKYSKNSPSKYFVSVDELER